MCIIPYGTQVGEISFCAYNTGVGWRQIVEKAFSTHSTARWFEERGRHPVYAAGKTVPLESPPQEAVKQGVPKAPDSEVDRKEEEVTLPPPSGPFDDGGTGLGTEYSYH
jgi:hypothetical protein